MPDQKFLELIKKGVETWNTWKEQNPTVRADFRDVDFLAAELLGANLSIAKLSKANLSRAKLMHANLEGADLSGADLSMSNLSGANLCEVRLAHANLTGADLTGANFSRANLREANLSMTNLNKTTLNRANLSGVNFGRANMSTANLTEAKMYYTILAAVDLSNVVGLDMVDHRGPSIVGIETLYNSKGELPEIFLRGVGTPENFIAQIKSLVGSSAIDFYSCFISYSRKDQEFADRLHADLQNSGVRCWFAPHDIQGGKKIHEQIDAAIRIYDKLLLIVSDASMDSEWVKTEIANARQKEKDQGRRSLFPIALVSFSEIKKWKSFDADIGKDSAREIREYFIPDFSNWKENESYQKSFDRLLRDLKADNAERL